MDKTDQLIAASTTLIETCTTLIYAQNADSYKTVRVPKLNSIKLSHKAMDSASVDLAQFYLDIMPIVRFVHDLKHTLADMIYPHDELMIHVDKSPAFVLDLEHKLANRTAQISEYLERLTNNLHDILTAYRQFLHSRVSELNISADYLDLIYKCMGHDFKFIQYGTAILDQLFADGLVATTHRDHITRLSNHLKEHYLSAHQKDTTDVSKQDCLLQTFNLIPTLNNMSLTQVLAHLFSVSISKASEDNLESLLKTISKQLPNPVAFIISARDNNDFYYDLTNLFDQTKMNQIESKAGITNDYIDLYKTLQATLIKKPTSTRITAYNLDDRAMIYMLWTNDYENFKLREQPIDMHIAKQILSGRSSNLIAHYNNQFEANLLQSIVDHTNTSISYKQTKYLAFDFGNDIDDEEHAFIDQLCKKFIDHVKALKAPGISGLAKQFIKIAQTTFNKFKPFHVQKNIPLHARLVYSNATIRIAERLEREIAIWAHTDQSDHELHRIVKVVVASNDNIYTKFIASYYLARSSELKQESLRME